MGEGGFSQLGFARVADNTWYFSDDIPDDDNDVNDDSGDNSDNNDHGNNRWW